MTGRWCPRAQRRLPSMTIAMCRGALSDTLDRQDLLLFGVADLVGARDVEVGELLQLGLEPLLVVGRDAGALRLRTQLVLRVVAERADLHPALLHLLGARLHEVLAPLLGQCRVVGA